MRELLRLACCAFPRDHRARQSDEVLDTALLAAGDSGWRAAREAVSLVGAGMRQRLRAEPHRSSGDGVALLAGLLALVNLAVALAGIGLAVDRPRPIETLGPLVVARNLGIDWWWIAFTVAAAGIVLGLVLGNRRLALGAAVANLGIVAYDAIFLAGLNGHLDAVVYLQGAFFPAGWEWLPPAVVLAAATAVAPLHRLSLWRLPLALVAAVVLVVLSREAWAGFFFLRWPLAAVVVLAVAFGWLAPRLAVVAIGLSLAVAPTVVAYLSVSYAYHDPVVKWVAAPGLAIGVVLPLAYLTRRRLT
jgi:hypothetical protein